MFCKDHGAMWFKTFLKNGYLKGRVLVDLQTKFFRVKIILVTT